jgi:tRNA threonylcarbamoyladenosine biosynthesis protein TsaB
LKPLILNIDTATEHASICLSRGEESLGLIESTDQKNHAAFLQPAIEQLMKNTNISLQDLDAVAVTAGPGSYTGLRVGLASAKGICFALNKPLIMVGTLEVIARSMLNHLKTLKTNLDPDSLLCPMIDARRMEVFTAEFTTDLDLVKAPYALIIDETAFTDPTYKKPLIFSGSGHSKLIDLVKNSDIRFINVQHHAGDLAIQANLAFSKSQFANLAYAEPLYVKAFFDTSKKKIAQ